MKQITFILILFLFSTTITSAQNRHRNNHRKLKNNTISLTPTYNVENIEVENENLVFYEYSCEANFKTTNDNGYYPAYYTRDVKIEWPTSWGKYDFEPLHKALLTWMGYLWSGDNANPNQFITVDNVLNTYCVKGSKSFPGQKDLTKCMINSIKKDIYTEKHEHRFECRYISSDVCIYEHVYYSEYCREGNVNYFYYDIKNNKVLNINDLITSKSDIVQTIANEYNKIIEENDRHEDSRYANDFYKQKIKALRLNGIKDLLIEKDQITYVYDFKDNDFINECYASVPLSDAMPTLTNRTKEIIYNMPEKNKKMKNLGGSRPVVGILYIYRAKETLEYTQKGDMISDSNNATGRVVDYSPSKFKFEDDNTDVYECYYYPKTKVRVDEYGYNELLLNDIGNRVTFISNDGKSKVQILKYYENGHKFLASTAVDAKRAVKDATDKTNDYYDKLSTPKYVLCLEIRELGVWFVPLEIEGDHVRLYTNNERYNAGSILDATQLRYKSHTGIHFLDYGVYGHYTISSFFDTNGNMIHDISQVEDMPEDISIAYLHDSQELYLNGEFYKLLEKDGKPVNEASSRQTKGKTTTQSRTSHITNNAEKLTITKKKRTGYLRFREEPRYMIINVNIDWPVACNGKSITALQKKIIDATFERNTTNIDAIINEYCTKRSGGKVVKTIPKAVKQQKAPWYQNDLDVKCTQVAGRYATFQIDENTFNGIHGLPTYRRYVNYDMANNRVIELSDIIVNMKNRDFQDLLMKLIKAKPYNNLSDYKDRNGLKIADFSLKEKTILFIFDDDIEGYFEINVAKESIAQFLTEYGKQLLNVESKDYGKSAQEIGKDLKQAGKDAYNNTKEDIKDLAKEKTNEAIDKTKEAAEKGKEKGKELLNQGKEALKNLGK